MQQVHVKHPLFFYPESRVRRSLLRGLAVLLTFVLARVFAEGTLMREDLEGTV